MEVKTGGVGGKVAVVGESSESQETQISGVGGEVVEVKTGGVGGKVAVVGESSIRIKSVCANAAECKKRLSNVLAEVGPSLQWQEKDKLWCLLLNNHHTFAVDERDRGETDLVQMRVDTGDATPRRQPVRRTPFAVCQEVANQLRKCRVWELSVPRAAHGLAL